MDLSFPDLNYYSVETLPGFDGSCSVYCQSASVFKEDVDIVPTIVDDTLSYVRSVGRRQSDAVRLARTSQERRHRPPAAFVAQRRKKHRQPANVCLPFGRRAKGSTLRSAMAPGCNTAPPKPLQRSRMMSRTSFSTTTSLLAFSASVRTLSTSASP